VVGAFIWNMIIVRHNLSRQSPEPRSKRKCVTQDEAAVKIQSVWRGRKQRADCQKRRDRNKPWGYYTHTLGLTYLSACRGENSAKLNKRSIYLLLEVPDSSWQAQILSAFIIVMIVVSITAFVLETVPGVYDESPTAWFTLEVFCTAVFTIEYTCRLAVCEESKLTRLMFATQALNVCDLIAILPFYLEILLSGIGVQETSIVRVLRVVRLFRVTRVFKLGRYASGMRLMGTALKNSSQAISVLVFLLCMGVMIFSSALYHVEKLSCPERKGMIATDLNQYLHECAEVFNRGWSPRFGLCCNEHGAPNDFPSIIAASWWSVVTMTSVGYGEVYPRTALGKCVGFVAMLVGMVLIALPVAIVGQKFQDVYETHGASEPKFRGFSKLLGTDEAWTLVPPSDICSRLKKLRLKDPTLTSSVLTMVARLEDSWEVREVLGRERKIGFERQTMMNTSLRKVISGMEDHLEQPLLTKGAGLQPGGFGKVDLPASLR